MAPTFIAILIILFSISVSALPSPQSIEAKTDVFQWQIYKSCSQENRDMVTRAWEDSKRLADALESWNPNGQYQAAMEMYMGDRCTYEDFLGYNFKKQIQDTSRRSRGLYDGKSEYGHAYLWVYCNEDSFWFKDCEDDGPGVILAYEQQDWYFNNWYITFCPAFYNSKYQVPLDDLIKKIKDGDLDPMVMENWSQGPESQAATFFHETMHMSQLVTSPGADDKAYGAKNVYNLARNQNTDSAVYNADSWTLAATAILAQKSFDLPNPPYPRDYPPTGVTIGKVDDGGTSLTTVFMNVTNFVPEGAGTREQGKPFNVDLSKWEVYNNSTAVNSPTPAPCASPIPMNDCVNKSGKCFCKTAACMLGVDCYTVEAKNCDAACKGCQFPTVGMSTSC